MSLDSIIPFPPMFWTLFVPTDCTWSTGLETLDEFEQAESLSPKESFTRTVVTIVEIISASTPKGEPSMFLPTRPADDCWSLETSPNLNGSTKSVVGSDSHGKGELATELSPTAGSKSMNSSPSSEEGDMLPSPAKESAFCPRPLFVERLDVTSSCSSSGPLPTTFGNITKSSHEVRETEEPSATISWPWAPSNLPRVSGFTVASLNWATNVLFETTLRDVDAIFAASVMPFKPLVLRLVRCMFTSCLAFGSVYLMLSVSFLSDWVYDVFLSFGAVSAHWVSELSEKEERYPLSFLASDSGFLLFFFFYKRDKPVLWA